MEAARFDRVARLLGVAASRRDGLLAAVLLAGGRAASPARADGSGPEPEGICGSGKKSRCTRNSDCCTNYCDPRKNRCRCIKNGKRCRKNQTCCGNLICTGKVCARPVVDPVCSAASCPTGCCRNGQCVAGTTADACGTGGAACATCAAGAFCSAGACGTWRKRVVFGSEGSGPSAFYYPRSVFLSADATMAWIADTGNARISVWSWDGSDWSNVTTFGRPGSSANQFDNPQGVFVSADGRTAWVADTVNNRISIWERSGGGWSNAGSFGSAGDGPGQFSLPTGVAVSADGATAWVADKNNNRISVWSSASGSWQPDETFGTAGDRDDQFSYPNGVYASADGRTVAVADSNNNRVSVWRKAGSSWANSAILGGPGVGPGEFDNPTRIAVAPNGLTGWVADTNNDRISVWTRSGSSWSDQTTFGTSEDFIFPTGVAVSADGRTVLVADNRSHNVSMWELV